ncbi:hypothetical protein [Gulosibacter faecalis]|jgi:hypothetical protein|uniref:Uncharacterized protein n=1 Tax=Gulosibacter faecalis TaxID=272240 RepID=A0ABW5UWL0_9MICO|nr:hypothetical protein [Gulosibacter faecalis]
MFAISPVIQAADDVMIVHPGEMWFPPIVFGILTLVILLALALVAFSFRNMAASHPVNSEVSPYEPVGHPGHPIEGPSHEGAQVAHGHEDALVRDQIGRSQGEQRAAEQHHDR